MREEFELARVGVKISVRRKDGGGGNGQIDRQPRDQEGEYVLHGNERCRLTFNTGGVISHDDYFLKD